MRIVGGALRGRGLTTPRSQAIRPTSDRLRESIFDILFHAFGDPITNANVIDLFAGTGALGLEALSRGAKRCLFVDEGAQARALLRANIDALALGGVTRVFRRDATRLGEAPKGEMFSLAFLDPPYGKNLVEPCLNALSQGLWLTDQAILLVEESAASKIILPQNFTLLDHRRYGDTQINFLVFKK
ncbi:MAG: 16S rRNA (guanine(966)-N(2))-methyltransferase RsmD [Methylocystaceae bacterium]|jgi:16S rRNA (guanine966-N2)-methyltransferase|nr:16S rRNA (guanine(966)-N(2))-methyltransferase RsmD [Methylocystaceae bacterium]NBT97266.1 16S rRNA (guanine(966)-N(2))-methyltransferase RsmD [Methylocystaceae bacterium]